MRLHQQNLPLQPVRYWHSLAINPTNGQLAVAGPGNKGAVNLWDLHPLKQVSSIPPGPPGATSDMKDSPDGNVLALTRPNQTVELYETRSLARLRTLKHFTTVQRLAFHPKEDVLVVASSKLTFWNWRTGTKIREQDLKVLPTSMAISPDGKWVAVGGHWQDVLLFDATTGKQEPSLLGHSGMVNALVFSADSKRLISAGIDTKIKVWNLITRREVVSLTRHDSPIHSLAISHAGVRSAAGSVGRITIYDAGKGYQHPRP